MSTEWIKSRQNKNTTRIVYKGGYETSEYANPLWLSGFQNR